MIEWPIHGYCNKQLTCEKTKLKYFWTFEQLNKWTLFKCSFEHLNKWTWTNVFCSNVHLNVWTNEHEQGPFWTCSEQMNMNTLFLSVFRTNEHEQTFFERVRNKWTWTRLFLNVFRTNEHEHTFFERVQRPSLFAMSVLPVPGGPLYLTGYNL